MITKRRDPDGQKWVNNFRVKGLLGEGSFRVRSNSELTTTIRRMSEFIWCEQAAMIIGVGCFGIALSSTAL